MFTVVCRETRQLIAFVVGRRTKATLKRLWEKVKHIECAAYYTDGWRPYHRILPKAKHIVSKKETYTVESKNSQIRTYTKRFFRKTKGFSKDERMIYNGMLMTANKINRIAEKKYGKRMLRI